MAAVILAVFITGSAADDTISFTDAMGRTITMDKPAESIAYYMVGDPVRIVGAGDQIVARDGRSDNKEMFPGYQDLPEISSYEGMMNLDYEKIVSLNPDIMIIGMQDWNVEGIEQAIETLEPEVPVVVLDFLNPDTMSDNYRKLGKITGHTSEAEEYIAYYEGIISQITSKTGSLDESERPAVLIMGHGMSSPDELYTYGSGYSPLKSVLSIAGARNTAADLPSAYTEFNPEWVMSKDIDLIVREAWTGFYPDWVGLDATNPASATDSAKKLVDETMQKDIFARSNAVKSGNVHLVNHNLWENPIVYAAYLAKWAHPDLFADLDPQGIYQEYLTRFMRSEYDLTRSGMIGY